MSPLQGLPAAVLVDTSVVWLYLCDHPMARPYDAHLAHKTLCIAALTLGELHRWAMVNRFAPSHLLRLDTALRRYALLPADRSLARHWADLLAEASEDGRKIGHDVAWIAATARHYSIPLITHDPEPFAGIGGIAIETEYTPDLE